jgi:hypothetical protein
MTSKAVRDIRSFRREELAAFVAENLKHLLEDEALAILDNPIVSVGILQMIAQTARLTAFYSVRLRLVAHRGTPQAHAIKLVHYLYWTDLIRLSIDVKVPAPVRRSIDNLLLLKVDKLSLGEKIASAKRCSAALIKVFVKDPDPRVLASLMVNQRVREEDLLLVAGSDRASPDQLRLLAADHKWSYRYAIRKALAMNPRTPRSVAASQLRFLSRRDLRTIHRHPATSVYLRRCIERLHPSFFPAEGDRID